MEYLFNKCITVEPRNSSSVKVKSYNQDAKRNWYYSKSRNLFCAFPDKYSKNPEQEFQFLCYGTHKQAKIEFGKIVSKRINRGPIKVRSFR